jgi:hypothetical protein
MDHQNTLHCVSIVRNRATTEGNTTMTASEQFYNNAKDAQAKWTESVKSVYDEARKAFEGNAFQVDASEAGERVQKGIDQVFDFWSKAIDFNRDLAKKVADANLEYLNVLKSQAEAAGEQYVAKFEEARARAEKVARETQEALLKSAVELEKTAGQASERATEQVQKNVAAAREQTAKLSQKAAEQAEKATTESERTASRARSTTTDQG